MEEFICNCGRKFDNKRSLIAHGTHCNKYIKFDKNSKYKISNNLYRCECGKEFSNYQSLNGHFGHCEKHCEILGKETSHHHKGSMQWEKFSNDEIKEFRKKAGKTKLKKYFDGELIPTFTNKQHTEQTKRKIRESTVKYLDSKGGARYSTEACKYIDRLNEQNHWNLQHAKNGGEIVVCGYYLDGYDKELNIVVEYDEPYHYTDVYNNILREKDIKRQNEIIQEINPTFYRYNQKLNLLYKIN